MNRKCLAVVFGVFGVVGDALADIPHPPTYYRLRRIGYEVVPLGMDVWTIISYVVALFLVSFLLFRNDKLRLSVKTFVKRASAWLAYVAFVCGLIMISAFVVKIVPGQVRDVKMLVMCDSEKEAYYHPRPGWKYENQVTESERKKLMERIEKLKPELQEMLDNSGIGILQKLNPGCRDSAYVGRVGDVHEEEALIRILSKNKGMLKRCRGIPIEYMLGQLDFWRRLEVDMIREVDRIRMEKAYDHHHHEDEIE